VTPKEDGGKREVLGFVGVGLDGKDGHKRLTHSEHFFIVGGSAETHERMQDTAVRFGENLKKKGKTLKETEPEEALDILRDSLDD
jgi:hypothetical protein